MSDDSEIRTIQEKMQECLVRLRELAPHVGAARQVKEFASDQRKNLLAKFQAEYIAKGESVAGAEILARSNPLYFSAYADLQASYHQAEVTLAEWQYTLVRLDACRSMLAMSRETLRTLDG